MVDSEIKQNHLQASYSKRAKALALSWGAEQEAGPPAIYLPGPALPRGWANRHKDTYPK